MSPTSQTALAAKTLWICTEERLSRTALGAVLAEAAARVPELGGLDLAASAEMRPSFTQPDTFDMEYEVVGTQLSDGSPVSARVLIVSGTGSFTDVLCFYESDRPDPATSSPVFAMEITKTTNREARNTVAAQRAIKAEAVRNHYRLNLPIITLYDNPSDTAEEVRLTSSVEFIFRCLATADIVAIGRNLPESAKRPFSSLSELLDVRRRVPGPTNGTPITISVEPNRVLLTGKLEKAGALGHDPNKGGIAAIVMAIRALGDTRPVVVQQHGLSQHMLKAGPLAQDKFIRLCHRLNVRLDGLTLPAAIVDPAAYWQFSTHREKTATLLLHNLLDLLPDAEVVFDNHAGCELGYLRGVDGQLHQPAKAEQRPDLGIVDALRGELILVEGEMIKNMRKGVAQLSTWSAFEQRLQSLGYQDLTLRRCVVVQGGTGLESLPPEVAMQVTDAGRVRLTATAPAIFVEALGAVLGSAPYRAAVENAAAEGFLGQRVRD